MTETPLPPSLEQEIEQGRHQLIINANYEFFILTLTLLQVINSVLWLLLRHRQEEQVILLVSFFVSLILLGDSIYQLMRTPKPLRHLLNFYGWMLWVGSLPLPFLALLRLLRYRLLAKWLKRRDWRNMFDVAIERRAASALLATLLAVIVVFEIAATVILEIESAAPNANIHNASDAVWWTIVTVATVGYGDKYPVTTPGRVIGAFVIVLGVALFSVLTGFLSQWFLRPRSRRGNTDQAAEIVLSADTRALLARLDQLNSAQQAQIEQLSDRLAALEQRLPSPPTDRP
ncbi:MAG: potassium channel family protein [Anaerolineae bacterium]